MQKYSDRTHGIIGSLHIIILSIIMAVLVIVYFGIYSALNLILSPLHSVFGATFLYFIMFVFVIIYRFRNGPLVSEDDIKNSAFYREPLPEIEDYDTDELEENGSVVTTDSFDEEEIEEEPDGSEEEDVPDIHEDEIPKELYIKVVQDDDYTMADAKRDTVEQQEEDNTN